MAKRISKYLHKGGSVRPGIVRILLLKAWKPEHVKAALQGLTWLQVKYNIDLDGLTLDLLLKAITRANAPEIAVELFSSMNWLRVFPTVEQANRVLQYFATTAFEAAQKSPRTKGPRTYDAEAVEPAADALEADENEEAPAEAAPLSEEAREKHLQTQFTLYLAALSNRTLVFMFPKFIRLRVAVFSSVQPEIEWR